MNPKIFSMVRIVSDALKQAEISLKYNQEVETMIRNCLAQADRSDPNYETAVKLLHKFDEYKTTLADLKRCGQEIYRMAHRGGSDKPLDKKSGCYHRNNRS